MKSVFRVFVATLTLAALSVHASVVIVGTRVIYPAGSRDVSVRLLNRGDRPALVQAWIDTGDASATPDAVRVPFSLSPTLARIEADRGQVLRLTYTGEPLPQDKESVFWLNMLEVPPKPADAENINYLQFALRTRIKIFYRPKQLKGDATEALLSVHWRLLHNGDTWSVEATNASPFHVSLGSVSVLANAKATEPLGSGTATMLAPGQTSRFDLANVKPDIAIGSPVLRYEAINDYGAVIHTDAPLAPANK